MADRVPTLTATPVSCLRRPLPRPAAGPLPPRADHLARELATRGWTPVRAWRGVLGLGPPDRETAQSHPFKHGFRGGWDAHEADPDLDRYPEHEVHAYQGFLRREGFWDVPASATNARRLWAGFSAGVSQRAAVLREAGLLPVAETREGGR